MGKRKTLEFRIQENTDTVDIDAKCLGLNAWVVGDSVNLLNTNRGLSIQIRHNRDKETFEAANKLSQLVSAAPEMLRALNQIADFMARDGIVDTFGVTEAIDKAEKGA